MSKYLNVRQIVTVADQEILVKKYRVIGTRVVCYNAYELDMFGTGRFPNHSSITHDDASNRWWGQLGSRELPPEIDALPVGPERWAAIDAYRDAQHELAYRAILAACPEAAQGERRRGEVEIILPE